MLFEGLKFLCMIMLKNPQSLRDTSFKKEDKNEKKFLIQHPVYNDRKATINNQ